MRSNLVVLALLINLGCKTGVQVAELESYVSNNLENNEVEIERIKKELKDFEIDTLAANISLVNDLEQAHRELIAFNDSLNTLPYDQALQTAGRFYQRHFQYTSTVLFATKDFDFSGVTSKPLIKLHFARLETLFINDARRGYDYGPQLKFDRIFALIVPDKILLNKGEKLSGRVSIAGGQSADTNDAIRSIHVNGHELVFDGKEWRFEFLPSTNGSGVTKFDLKADITMRDGKMCKGETITYIKN